MFRLGLFSARNGDSLKVAGSKRILTRSGDIAWWPGTQGRRCGSPQRHLKWEASGNQEHCSHSLVCGVPCSSSWPTCSPAHQSMLISPPGFPRELPLSAAGQFQLAGVPAHHHLAASLGVSLLPFPREEIRWRRCPFCDRPAGPLHFGQVLFPPSVNHGWENRVIWNFLNCTCARTRADTQSCNPWSSAELFLFIFKAESGQAPHS